MCGIAGIVHVDRNRLVDETALMGMRESMVHRGPDGAGIFLDKEVGLAHRRLSIIDLSERGHQPYHSPDGRFAMVFNGEIFNYRELRVMLESRGVSFVSESDTEVLLHGFIQFGASILDKLNGMFAFAVWDNRERQLFLARDRVGVKPLYYAFVDQTLFFASEPKALFAAGVPVEEDPAALKELLLFKYVAGENTVFRHVYRLLPGHWMTFQEGKIRKTRWWNLAEKIMASRESLPSDPFAWFEETFYSSVKYRSISDVPIGVMLSGGLDSGSVAAALHRNGEHDLAAFTFVFDDERYNEGHLAKLVADKFGLTLHSVSMGHDQLMKTLQDAAWYYDEPLVHQNDAHMLALSRTAKKHVTVLLSGEGGDEFMGGYVRYKTLQHPDILRMARMFSGILQRIPSAGIVNRFDKLSRYLSDSRIRSLVLLNASNVYPADLQRFNVTVDMDSFEYRNTMLSEAERVYPGEPARQAMYLDVFTHMASVLDRNDRMTMGAGIECRVPFMDFRFMEMIPALPSNYLLKGRKGKYLLLNSVARQLPQQVVDFKKLGFSVPWERVLAEDPAFGQYLREMESGMHMDVIEGFSPNALIRDFRRGNTLASAMVRQLLMIAIWKEHYVRIVGGSATVAS